MATFVLIPGGWHGGWYFESFAEALRARGHRAYAVTLTGLGEQRDALHPPVNLDTHIGDVVRLLDAEQLSNVVLLAHSYGGMVLRGVLDRVPDRIAAALYVDAYVPNDGESCFELATDRYRSMFLEGATRDGFSVPPPAHLDARTAPHPLASFLQRLHLTQALPPIRLGYVYLNGWDATPFTPVYERVVRDPAWETFTLAVGHNVIAEAFDELLAIALEFAV
ncbi:MAG TPA: alpha/beta fold hydrolase [Gemmatimonadaceae bacterium]